MSMPAPRDPSNDVRPDFGGPAFARSVAALSAATTPPTAASDVIASMEAEWDQAHEAEKVAWEAHRALMDTAQAAADEADRLAAAAQAAADAEAIRSTHEAEAEAAAKKVREAAAKRKAAITFPEASANAAPSDEAPLLLHPFAMKQLDEGKYVLLDYFSVEALERSAAAHQRRVFEATAAGELELGVGTGVKISTGASTPDPKIRPDAKLSWDQMQYCAYAMVEHMAELGYSRAFRDELLRMYTQLSALLPYRNHKALGDAIIIQYAADIRLQYYALKEAGKDVFDIGRLYPSKLDAIKSDLIDARLADKLSVSAFSLRFKRTLTLFRTQPFSTRTTSYWHIPHTHTHHPLHHTRTHTPRNRYMHARPFTHTHITHAHTRAACSVTPTSTSAPPAAPPTARASGSGPALSNTGGHNGGSAGGGPTGGSNGGGSGAHTSSHGKRPRDGDGGDGRDAHRVFQGGARGSSASACVICLGRDRHDVGRCRRGWIWDNSRQVFCERFSGNNIYTREGNRAQVCFRYNLGGMCTNRDSAHLAQHMCSGCGNDRHNAQSCGYAQAL
jgi:hypothetical protein